MKIMLAVTNMTAANGGVTTHIIDLCREFTTRNMDVVLVFDYENCDYMDKIEGLKNDFLKIYNVPMKGIQSNPKRLLECTRAICRIIKREKVDIMHAHSQSLCVVGALIKLLTGVPYIWTNHIDAIDKPEIFKIILSTLKFPIISVSTDLKEMLIKDYGIKEKRINVVNNGIDVTGFEALSEEERASLEEKFGVRDKYIIGLLARVHRAKGHMYLLKAVEKIQNSTDIKNIKILIAGKVYDSEKGYFEEIMTYSEEHNIDVEYVGFQRPRDVFGICDISVLPSIYEGFGLTVVESLAMGCPVIRANTPGWQDMKDEILVFEKGNVDQLASHILYAYKNPDAMNEMKEKGRRKTFEKFTIKVQVDETLKVYGKYLR